MNLVDSSAWLEYFADGPNADAFAQAVEATDDLIVPTICLYEVFKAVLRQRGESAAFSAIALMRQGRVVDLTERIALLAADLSLQTKLPMADSIILATARMHDAHIWTQDEDFDGLDGVTYVVKQ
jgi:predicted nucleic acid-binding protein